MKQGSGNERLAIRRWEREHGTLGKRWGVWCAVSGGVTGHREAWLKRNGERWEFPTREAAELVAARLRKDANGPYATARFSYEPAEIAE